LSPLLFACLAGYFVLFRAHVTLLDPVFCGLAVCSTLIEPNALIGRFLEVSILRWIGRLSYSLYIWQQLFLGFGVVYRPFGFLSSPQLATVSAVLMACLSYYLLELPLMRLGHRITSKSSREKRAFAVASGAALSEQTGLVGPIAEAD
jgi:peptidoglycan/LPS O-acetylase OafA/YrhL